MTSAALGATGATVRGGDPFEQVATTLRVAVIEYYRRTGDTLAPSAWLNTIETNSGYVSRRGRPMVELLYSRTGLASLHGVRLLDVGCGFGALAVFFAAQGAQVTGIDPNARRLEVGREAAARHDLAVALRKGRMEALEFPDAAFDALVMNNSLCYVVDPTARSIALHEALRVLRPGGCLLIRNPSRLVARDQFSGLPLIHFAPPRLARRMARALGRHRSHVRLRTPGGARRELRAAGFTEVELVGAPGSRVPRALQHIARYQHVIGTRPVAD